MSSGIRILFDQVTKRYRTPVAPAGLKEWLLRLASGRRDQLLPETSVALDAISLEVSTGECFGIIGPNGSGKTTLLGLIAGVLKPDAGSVHTQGRVGPLLAVGVGFRTELSGAENVMLSGVLLGLTRKEVRQRFGSIVEFAGLERSIDHPVRTYSSGMLMRLGYAVVIHVDADILAIDELLAVGDREFQARCLEKLDELHREGVTIVLVSHNVDMMKRMCSRVVLLRNGRLTMLGSAEQVIRSYVEALPAPAGAA